MDIVLVPGLWLDGASWRGVVPALEAAGHRAHPVTLPGTGVGGAERAGVRLADLVAAVVALIDAADPGERVLLVGHSAGAAVVHAAVDARPTRVARAVYIGGFPTADGDAPLDGFEPVDGGLVLPDWPAFADEELRGLDPAARAAFLAGALVSPACFVTDVQRLGDRRRYDVPVTVLCPEFTAADLRGWIDGGALPVRELARIRRVDLVDLATGHWPQLTDPTLLAGALLACAASVRPADAPAVVLDDQGRPDPPIDADEIPMLLAFLDHLRATVAWKTDGIDDAGASVTVGRSALTLGGLLAHLAFAEDLWCARHLHGRPPGSRFGTLPVDRDRAWPEGATTPVATLRQRWLDAVDVSRAAVDEAIAAGGLDHRAVVDDSFYGRPPTLRWILLHLVREYARHVGHADLLREAVDGAVGE